MNIVLPPELEKFVKDQVNAGAYPTENDVVREALRRFVLWSRLEKERLDALRRDIQIGDDQLAGGEGRPLDGEAVKRRGREAPAKLAKG